VSGWGQPSGNPLSPLVVVARDFGWQEDRAGIPLVGPSGKLLAKAVAKAGLYRGDALLTNVVNLKPPGDKWEAHVAADVSRGVAELHELLGRADRRLIVTLGNEAFRTVTQGTPHARTIGIEEARGYVWPSPYGPVLAMTHPAAIMRQWVPWWACFNWDWQRAARILSGTLEVQERRERVIHTAAEAEEFVEAALHAPLLAVDSETDGEGWGVTPQCVAFSFDSSSGVCFPLADWTRPYVAALLESRVPKVLQNGQFDCTVLERNGLPVAAFEIDVMLLWHAVEPLLAGKRKEGQRTEKNLRFMASLLVDGQPYWKSYDFATPEDRWRLCSVDARCTLEIAQKLLRRLEAV
jgi:uracil-DNA glycosylase family 4